MRRIGGVKDEEDYRFNYPDDADGDLRSVCDDAASQG